MIPMRVGVLAKPAAAAASEFVARVHRRLSDAGVAVVADAAIAGLPPAIATAPASALPDLVDLLVVLGGDGTMLTAARLLGGRQLPVMGINLGSLGYLTEYASGELDHGLEQLLRGEFAVSVRLMLEAVVTRAGRQAACGLALNDVVLHHASLARILEIQCRVDGDFVTRFRCDGLIVATPTGSTAHNLSAGGPIVAPEMDAITITPICPHTLSHRPLVVAGSTHVQLELVGPQQPATLTLDGQEALQIERGDAILVRASNHKFRVVHPPGRSDFKVLRDKLGWGAEVLPHLHP